MADILDFESEIKRLIEAEQKICRLVDEVYIDERGLASPIYDGVIVPALYLKAPKRILWILKEPWDGVNSSGGEWSLSKCLAEKPVSELSQSTFHPIIYITYGIFKNVAEYNKMPRVKDMDNPEDLLRSIAFINVKKLPGVTRGAYSPTIMSWYGKGREIIKRQLEAYQPDIVFGCSPHFPSIMEGLIPELKKAIKTSGSADYASSGSRIYVHVHHPGQTQNGRAKYVDDALAAVLSAQSDQPR
jgi:hypothetical protein